MTAPVRKLAAILAADVAGYSKLMGKDETGTLAALRELRQGLSDAVAGHRGEVVKSMGDGWLVEFTSVVDAVNCALQVQKNLAGHEIIKLRIGIHIGDIVHEDEDIYGDGVNIAARLQEISEPGGIALSDSARRSLDGKLAARFEDVGEKQLKNIAEAVRVYISGGSGADAANEKTPLALPDKPSIAVLPFDNMSGDPEQEYFADGIAEDVITALSRFRSLFVIARNSSFTYKGGAVDITQVARDLGVRYVVEGSVRRAGNRVRITAQLIDAGTANHLWADRFDGALDDVFELQDQITEQIVVAVEPEIGARERERVRRKPPENLNAWELVQRGLSHHYRLNKADRAEAIRLFREAVVLDPNFAVAHAYLAFSLSAAIRFDSTDDTAKSVVAALFGGRTGGISRSKRSDGAFRTGPATYLCRRDGTGFWGNADRDCDQSQSCLGSIRLWVRTLFWRRPSGTSPSLLRCRASAQPT
ncbi:MAG: adenylate/guanylate cyclase domain-containing protein [Rhodospirillaceae bacterium]|jgi:adenylate cyclase|nr:adenylate/guanylate cyclase domain-containing protein [Rhodospirillaceae bacterium]MBT4490909.1 adenylate/guanylate cyclase domain-containing protein [Rhodospirillaceae bacterium]MBT5894551.1 adenylate/guanylate cyclase domain-containing protein [Rhodospirillaceae bacterium]MBT6426224.1 adenylate/guanylate cyclase domain-containing protein [Rhodospirillaceae bacterium]MBT7759244.1 adenylate/guanylate cyclase domain-containing protein [Rhodospirillaceae bacterium]